MGDRKDLARTASPDEIARTFLAEASGVVIRSEGAHSLSRGATRDSEIEWSSEEERYAQLRELGRGGMGLVEEVFDATLGRPVARKRMLGHPDELSASLLIAEAQICAQLEHPAIVPVYDLEGDPEGRPFYTMRLVPGRTLRDVLEDNRHTERAHQSLAQLLGILRQVCLAVDYAHSKGVVHRDLKPENVIVGEFGEVYVLDWGIAHVLESSSIRRTTHERIVAGSPGYMAPEQALAESIVPETDIFALGVILYEIIAGDPPFDDSDPKSFRKRLSQPLGQPPSVRAPHRNVPAAFDAIVAACLELAPAQRPSSARAITEAIDAFLDGERARAERLKEADAHTREGEEARAEYERLAADAQRLADEGDKLLGETKPSDPVETKQPGWDLAAQSKRLSSEAARHLARAEAAFIRAIGRVGNHAGARRGLAALHFRQFMLAERSEDQDRMAQQLELARTYDDGELAVELSNQGELVVTSEVPGLEVSISPYRSAGLLLERGAPLHLGTVPTRSVRLEAGSYLVTGTHAGQALSYPMIIRRAHRHLLTLRTSALRQLPEAMELVPGGPFRSPEGRAGRFVEKTLGDFAIGRFPVTVQDYGRFLDALSESERKLRLPHFGGEPVLVRSGDAWGVCPEWVEGEGRRRVPREREPDLPMCQVTWFDALGYCRWLCDRTNLPFRLPTSAEWDKAMRGADGRPFPMSTRLDASFAKLLESRPESSQPEPVGAFPLDVSPYGVRDLAGGVGDWTSSPGDDEPLPTLADEDKPESRERRAIWRGGSWVTTSVDRSNLRYTQRLHDRAGWIGFRVALSLDSKGSSSLTVEPMKR